MNSFYICLSISLILYCIVPQTAAINCYVCTLCGSSLGTSTSCTSGQTCLKTVVSVAGAQTITRACSSGCVEVNTGSILGTGTTTTCCSTDLCNGSIQMSSGLITLLVLPLIALFSNRI
ncbi:hypothetical protein BpHYR1_006597 [Brachionus plicatilis]|uniref:Snake toxin/toxin-like domain-containing protein n=1 Tax=Brachionus plicatilis TaxID=10195 RepID=A0A3M7RAU9_BRAPC|nr:hypothetical protein BpHYR1_006597 [Brachionus plicatilis]